MHRPLRLSFYAVTISTVFFACGHETPPPAAAPATSAPAPHEAAPTATVTLGDAGELQGASIRTQSTSVVRDPDDTNRRPPAHASEPGRSVADIQTIIVAHRDEARACYDAAERVHPTIEGDLDIQWTIDPDGNVTDIGENEARSTIYDPSAVACIVAVIKKIHFAPSTKGYETHANYPFNFHPKSTRRPL